MYLFLALLVLILIFYHIFVMVRLMGALNRPKLLPGNEAELGLIRRHPEVGKYDGATPTIEGQKVGLIIYAGLIAMMMIIFFITLFTEFGDWYLLIIAFIPLLQMNNLTNVFAVLEEGVIVGSKFLSWAEVKGYEYQTIDLNHRFYGYNKDFNDGAYEVIFHQTIFSQRAVVSGEEMKARLDKILLENLGQPAEAKK